MAAEVEDTAETAVPPSNDAASGERTQLVEAEREDPEQQAEKDVAAAAQLLAAWEATKPADTSTPFSVTVEPFVGGPDAAFQIHGVTADANIQRIRELVRTEHPLHTAPDAQRLVVGEGKDALTLEDETLSAGAYGIGPDGHLTIRMGARDAKAAAERRERRVALRAAR
eukprot:COSAG04_NODE_7214_length_1166_cov_1.600750_3_plen_168_part_01